MRRLRRCAIEEYNTNRFWAKNIRTNGLVKVLVIDPNYDSNRCEVRYLDHNYIVYHDDLITLADYDAFVQFAEDNNISFDDAEQAMIQGLTLDQFKQQNS